VLAWRRQVTTNQKKKGSKEERMSCDTACHGSVAVIRANGFKVSVVFCNKLSCIVGFDQASAEQQRKQMSEPFLLGQLWWMLYVSKEAHGLVVGLICLSLRPNVDLTLPSVNLRAEVTRGDDTFCTAREEAFPMLGQKQSADIVHFRGSVSFEYISSTANIVTTRDGLDRMRALILPHCSEQAIDGWFVVSTELIGSLPRGAVFTDGVLANGNPNKRCKQEEN